MRARPKHKIASLGVVSYISKRAGRIAKGVPTRIETRMARVQWSARTGDRSCGGAVERALARVAERAALFLATAPDVSRIGMHQQGFIATA